MAGTATQGADLLMEFSEGAMNQQIVAYATQPPSETVSIGSPPRMAVLPGSGIGIRFLAGVGNQLTVSFRVMLGAEQVEFVTNPLPIQESTLPTTPPVSVVYLDLETTSGVVLTTSNSTYASYASEVLNRVVRPLLQRALETWLTRRGLPLARQAYLPLASPVPAPLQLAARVVTDTRMQRALSVFLKLTDSPRLAPTASGPVHINMGMAEAAIVLRNETLLTMICPQLAALFTPVDSSMPINFTVETSEANPRCINRVPARRMGTSEVVFPELFLEIRASESRLMFGGRFEFSSGSVHIGGGRFTVPFTVRWDNVSGQLVPVPGDPDVSLILDAWIFLAMFAGIVVGAAIGAAAGAVTGAIAAAIGGTLTAATGAAVGAIVGGVIMSIVLPIIVDVIGILGELMRAAVRSAAGSFSAPPIMLPLLMPMNLRPLTAQFDDFVVVGRPMVPSVRITGDLRIVRREFVTLREGLFREERLSWSGNFDARFENLHPAQFTWFLDGTPITGDGVLMGVRHSLSGAQCSLNSQMGVSINSRLCVEVREMSGFRVVACRSLRAEGQRLEVDEVETFDPILLSSPIRPIPDPRQSLFVLDAEAVVRMDQDFRAAVARGMDIDPGKLARQIQ